MIFLCTLVIWHQLEAVRSLWQAADFIDDRPASDASIVILLIHSLSTHTSAAPYPHSHTSTHSEGEGIYLDSCIIYTHSHTASLHEGEGEILTQPRSLSQSRSVSLSWIIHLLTIIIIIIITIILVSNWIDLWIEIISWFFWLKSIPDLRCMTVRTLQFQMTRTPQLWPRTPQLWPRTPQLWTRTPQVFLLCKCIFLWFSREFLNWNTL